MIVIAGGAGLPSRTGVPLLLAARTVTPARLVAHRANAGAYDIM